MKERSQLTIDQELRGRRNIAANKYNFRKTVINIVRDMGRYWTHQRRVECSEEDLENKINALEY
jgi:hypothetical protein